jgi:hypothetical protein
VRAIKNSPSLTGFNLFYFNGFMHGLNPPEPTPAGFPAGNPTCKTLAVENCEPASSRGMVIDWLYKDGVCNLLGDCE